MYLKSLEIIGFKSFSEKIELKFSPGMTVVVGPNGCGKSNLVDAVRWGLGGQSVKLLRGSKMEELIFCGSTERKPLNFAEVSLAFDKVDQFLPLDYREVAITRRMYRSGEGEYYLNKNACRLRDITELFRDTGIGTETYSFIGQGRVEELINARPEERRELFEEAAEISRYKQRRKAAGLRLDELGGNLLRIEDLLVELTGQQASLSQAAKEAKKFKELTEQLTRIEKRILLCKYFLKNKLLIKTKEKMNKIDLVLGAKQELLKGLQEKEALCSLDENKKLTALEEGNRLFAEQKQDLEKKRQGLDSVKEQTKFLEEKISLKKGNSKELQERVASLEGTCSKNQAELGSIREEQQALAKKASSLKNRAVQLKEEKDLVTLETLREQVLELNLEKNALGQSLQNNSTRGDELGERIRALEEEEKEKGSRLEHFYKIRDGTVASLHRIQLLQVEQNHLLEGTLQRIEELSAASKKKQDTGSNLQGELTKKKAYLQYLRESEENLNLYHKSVKAVMQATHAGTLKNVFGPVANLISAPPQYERAIDVALGGAVQHLVVADDTSAGLAIKFLKDKKVGRATFLPLNLIKPFSKKDLPPPQEGFLGMAARLVQAPVEFKKVVDYLLGGVLVAENLEAALLLARSTKGWRIVTLEGELITPGGAISGGYQAQERHGFLERKGELKKLENEILELEKKNSSNEEELENLIKRIREEQQAFKKMELKKKELEKNLLEEQSSLERFSAGKNVLKEELLSLQEKKGRLLVLQKELVEHGLSAEAQLEQVRRNLTLKEEELQKSAQKFSREEEELKKLEKDLVEVRVRFTALQEKESSQQQLLREYEEERGRLNLLLTRLQEEKVQLKAQLDELGTKGKTLLQAKELESGEAEKTEKGLILLQEEVYKIKQEKEELLRIKEKECRSLERYEQNYQRFNVEQIKAGEGLKYLQEQLLDRFKVTPELLQAEQPPEDEEEESLGQKKEYLAGEIAAMGDIRVGVIEEFERLKKRISFLEEQRQDLLEGEKGVQKIVGELDRHMKERFLQALETIKDNFLEIFVKLFGGGQALLRLSDPENVLDSGIEIVAQPPGKKLQNITLLSGGEKALTAIALLFALLQYKPVPFCVLDEIDSSLDENNLARFLYYLKKHTQETQFIVITHRRQTMEEADILYGITMEEKGVSKVISVNLTKKAG
jgi:chromosome segregation protein